MNTIRLYSTLTPEERKILGLNYPNDDLYRKFILKEKYGGNWPAISDKFIEEHGIMCKKMFYIYDELSCYEAGDIIRFNSSYFMALDYINPYWSPQALPQRWREVAYSDGQWHSA